MNILKIEVGTIIHELEKNREPWIFIVADINKQKKAKLFYFRTVDGAGVLFKLDKYYSLKINYIQEQIKKGHWEIIG